METIMDNLQNLLNGNSIKEGYQKHSHYLSFEIPFNMDKFLIDALVYSRVPREIIDCIYMPCRYQDGFTTQRDESYSVKETDDREYDFLLNYIQTKIPNSAQILIQGGKFLDNDTIKYYADHGVTKFCVGTYHHAYALKEYNDKFEVTMSITMGMQPKDLPSHPEYEQVFDRYVLPFNAGRDPKIIKQVPQHYTKILIPNHFCSPTCSGIFHWTSTPENGLSWEYPCPRNVDDMKLTGIIPPFDLFPFVEDVSVLKLVDRCDDTWNIIRWLSMYSFQEFWSSLPPEIKNDSYHNLDFYQRY